MMCEYDFLKGIFCMKCMYGISEILMIEILYVLHVLNLYVPHINVWF